MILYLASGSPRRRELLEQIGVRHQRVVVDVDESLRPGESAALYVERLAREKASAGLAALAGQPACVLGADTSVVLDGRILGKPLDRVDFSATLRALSGRAHQVLTAIAIGNAERMCSQVVSSEVHFRHISEQEIQAYWETGEPGDKAGGYAIQGLAAVFVTHLAGSYSAVVGLPVCETAALLDEFGIPVWNRSSG